jgi:hypothetical protein
MPLVSAALPSLADAIIGGTAITKFNNANAHVGVGNSNAAFNAAHTDLQGSSKKRKPVEAGYPQRTNETLVWSAIFETADANFEWLEWGIFNAASGGVMLNRSITFDTPPGTKTSSDVWRLVATTAFALA